MKSKFLNFEPEGWTDQNGGKFGWSENFNEHFNEDINEQVCGGACEARALGGTREARALVARAKRVH